MPSRYDEIVQDAIVNAINLAKDNIPDGRRKVRVFEKLEEALLLLREEDIRRELGY